MDCPKWFDPFIQKVIHLFSHPVWFVVTDPEVNCPCVDYVSHAADENCPHCFGTGKKIKLYRVMASNQNVSSSFRAQNIAFNEKNIVNVYYTDNATDIKVGDYVYDKNCLDIVSDVYYERSDDNGIVYWRIETQPKKSHSENMRLLIRQQIRKAGYDD